MAPPYRNFISSHRRTARLGNRNSRVPPTEPQGTTEQPSWLSWVTTSSPGSPTQVGSVPESLAAAARDLPIIYDPTGSAELGSPSVLALHPRVPRVDFQAPSTGDSFTAVESRTSSNPSTVSDRRRVATAARVALGQDYGANLPSDLKGYSGVSLSGTNSLSTPGKTTTTQGLHVPSGTFGDSSHQNPTTTAWVPTPHRHSAFSPRRSSTTRSDTSLRRRQGTSFRLIVKPSSRSTINKNKNNNNPGPLTSHPLTLQTPQTPRTPQVHLPPIQSHPPDPMEHGTVVSRGGFQQSKPAAKGPLAEQNPVKIYQDYKATLAEIRAGLSKKPKGDGGGEGKGAA